MQSSRRLDRADPARPSRRRRVLAGLTALMGFGEHGETAPVDLGLPAWVLLPAFFAAEVWAVHLHVRGKQAQSFTLSEVPLVVGLFACAPLPLLAARLIGGGAALVQGGRQSPIKLLYNLTCFAFETMLVIALFGLLRPGGDPLEPGGWLAAAAAIALAGTVSVALVVVAVTLTDQRPPLPTIGRHMLAGLVVGATNTSLSLLAVLAARANRAGALLVIVPALVLFVAYRAHHANRRRTGSLGLLHETNRLLQAAEDRTSAIEAVLRRLADVFGAERVELLLLRRGEDETGALFRYRVGLVEGPDPIDEPERCSWWSTLATRRRLGVAGATSPGAVRAGGGSAGGDQGSDAGARCPARAGGSAACWSPTGRWRRSPSRRRTSRCWCRWSTSSPPTARTTGSSGPSGTCTTCPRSSSTGRTTIR